jgi:hypothetical protein
MILTGLVQGKAMAMGQVAVAAAKVSLAIQPNHLQRAQRILMQT